MLMGNLLMSFPVQGVNEDKQMFILKEERRWHEPYRKHYRKQGETMQKGGCILVNVLLLQLHKPPFTNSSQPVTFKGCRGVCCFFLSSSNIIWLSIWKAQHLENKLTSRFILWVLFPDDSCLINDLYWNSRFTLPDIFAQCWLTEQQSIWWLIPAPF